MVEISDAVKTAIIMGKRSRKPMIKSSKNKSEAVLDTQLPTDPVDAAMVPKIKIVSPDGTDEIEVSQDVLESIKETASILSDPHLLEEIETAKKQARNGNIVSWESIKAKLGL